jgi:tripartite-type tricarboxylate transporter receptor subunit TctC
MTTQRCKVIVALTACILSVAGIGVAPATAYPERTITIVVPYPPGGSTDLMARVMAQKLQALWGQPVVIANQGGAGGSLGAARVAKATGDGYTLLMTTNSPLTTNLFLNKSLTYDTLRDFEPVVMVADSPMLLVAHPSLPANSLKELLALAAQKPGDIRAGISGNGATTHLAITELSRLAGVKFTIVPYVGGPPMLTAMLPGEEIQVGFSDIVPALPLVRDGKLKAIATPQLKRSVVAPEVPTLDESGMPGFNVKPWTGLFAPKGTPADVVQKLNVEINKLFAEPQFKARIVAIGQDPVAANTPGEFSAFVRSEIPRWREMVEKAGLSMSH